MADFEAGLAEVAAFGDPTCIGPLLDLFDDGSPYDELIFSVIHTVEAFPDRVYVSELLRATETLVGRCPRWARILHTRVLNAPATRAELAAAMRGQSAPVRASVLAVLEDVARRRPDFIDKVDEIRKSKDA